MCIWSEPATLEFLHLLVDYAAENVTTPPPGPVYLQWIGILKAKHNHVSDLEQMRTKYQRFRSCYLYMQEIKNDSGLRWNNEKQIVECEEERWQQFCKVIFLNYKNVVSCVTVMHFFIMS